MSKKKVPTKEELDELFLRVGNMKLRARMSGSNAALQLAKDQEKSFVKKVKTYEEETGEDYELPKL